MNRRAAVIVLDGVGIGAASDADLYADTGSNTLGNVATAVGGLDLPNLEALGLGCIAPLAGMIAVPTPEAAWGSMEPASPGKDSTTGHWELAGVLLDHPFPTYPGGFPADVIADFERATGRRVIGNVPTSGTEALGVYGEEHERTGAWIVYTSADSVFQVAAHEDIVPPNELYGACLTARELLREPNDVSRVIARPFTGSAGQYTRTAGRRDFSLQPPTPTLLDVLAAAGIERHGVGKVDDLFAHRAIAAEHTSGNAEGLSLIERWLADGGGGFLLGNLIDFDQLYGHRNDPAGFYSSLSDFDAALPRLLACLREEDLLLITADHGNDPTTESTDHARERVPLLVCGAPVRPLSVGVRSTFADVGATVAHWLGAAPLSHGRSFLDSIVPGVA